MQNLVGSMHITRGKVFGAELRDLVGYIEGSLNTK